MATLNVSLPEQLRSWVTDQVGVGRYSSASDYLRDLIRADIRQHDHGMQLLSHYLKPLLETSDEKFVSVTAADVKATSRKRMKE